jgi:1,2-phenylacetyl-CoA epoxidase catalytic subunit
MDQWEHLALTLDRHYFGTMDEPLSDWAVTLPDGSEMLGLQQILNSTAAQGWELVSLLPTAWGKNEAKALTAVFKRRGRS